MFTVGEGSSGAEGDVLSAANSITTDIGEDINRLLEQVNISLLILLIDGCWFNINTMMEAWREVEHKCMV